MNNSLINILLFSFMQTIQGIMLFLMVLCLKSVIGELLNLYFMEISFTLWLSKMTKKIVDTTINVDFKFLTLV